MTAGLVVDEIRLTVTMRGSQGNYRKASYAYTHGNLIIRIFNPSDYKINYRKY